MIEVREVTTRKGLLQFIKFPFTLYRGSPYWVPPLIREELKALSPGKNPAFETCAAKYWLAYSGNSICGRIAGIINRTYNEIYQTHHARFGWIDFVDDPAVSSALFNTVETWARQEGMTALHGPLGFTDMDPEGMLVEGFEELGTIATIYNYPYYPVHAERNGFRKDTDWLEFRVNVPTSIPEKADRIAALAVERRRVHLLDARKAKDFLPYAHGIFNVINETFKNLYGFVPLSPKQIDAYVKQYIPNVVPDYVKVILDEHDTVAAFVIAMPSMSKAFQKAHGRLLPFGIFPILKALRNPRSIDLFLGAVRTNLQGKGVDALLMTELAKSCIKNGIVDAESNVELEDNRLVQAHWKYFERRQHKRRRCFIKELT